jgi:hypothetical protein
LRSTVLFCDILWFRKFLIRNFEHLFPSLWNRLVLLLHKLVFESVNIIDNEAIHQRINVEEVQIAASCMVLVAMLYLLVYCQVGAVTKIWLGRNYTRTGLLQKIITNL